MTSEDAIHTALLILRANAAILDKLQQISGCSPAQQSTYHIYVKSLDAVVLIPVNARPVIQTKAAARQLMLQWGLIPPDMKKPLQKLFRNIEGSRGKLARRETFKKAWQNL